MIVTSLILFGILQSEWDLGLGHQTCLSSNLQELPVDSRSCSSLLTDCTAEQSREAGNNALWLPGLIPASPAWGKLLVPLAIQVSSISSSTSSSSTILRNFELQEQLNN